MEKQTELRFKLNEKKYDQFIEIATEMNMTTYALLRKLVDFTISEHSKCK